MKIYLVGGAVRDRLLGLPVRERDWVVVGATEEAMLDAGFRRADAEFPVFLHPETGEEYALARTETKTGPGYKGFAVEAGPQVELEQDLARRDLTINAMAQDAQGRLIDPFGGQADLRARRLRHITPAFVEDPVRLLRVARFAARFGALGFELAPETLVLMRRMATAEELGSLRPERVWKELRRALAEVAPWRFFELLHQCGALRCLIPELDAAITSSAEGAMDPLAALRWAVAASAEPAVRFAVVMYPALRNGALPEVLCRRLRAERDYSELLGLVAALGPVFARADQADAAALWRLLEQVRALQRGERFMFFLQACAALWPDVAAQATRRLECAATAAATVDARSLQSEGLSGPALGRELARRRIDAISDAVCRVG